MSYLNEGPWVGAALGKFDSSDSNRSIHINLRLEELKMLLRDVEENFKCF